MLIPVLVLMVLVKEMLAPDCCAACISLSQVIEKGSVTVHILQPNQKLAYQASDEKSIGKGTTRRRTIPIIKTREAS